MGDNDDDDDGGPSGPVFHEHEKLCVITEACKRYVRQLLCTLLASGPLT
jgi:hypothetical protein